VVPPDSLLDPDVAKYFGRPTGTVHVACMNAAGDMSCATSTSGLSFKIPGRVGDSPIIGAGLYVDNAVGTCGSTGQGEATLQNLSSFAAVELMRNGMSPVDAGLEVLRRVASHTLDKRILKEDGRPDFNVRFFVMGKDGRYAGVSLWGPGQFAVADEKGARLEDCVTLYRK
jgi:N4-(beta-N-acetylglucosaminyl)-L-asparaginase